MQRATQSPLGASRIAPKMVIYIDIGIFLGSRFCQCLTTNKDAKKGSHSYATRRVGDALCGIRIPKVKPVQM